MAVLVPPALNEEDFPPALAPTTESDGQSPAKKAKMAPSTKDDDAATATLISASENDKTLADIFAVGATCSKLLGEGNRDELVEKLLPKDKRIWVQQFVRDSQLLSGDFRRLSKELEKSMEGTEKADVAASERLRLAGCYLAMEKNSLCASTLLAPDLLESSTAAISSGRAGGTLHSFSSDNWHYAFVSEQQALAYTIRCVLYCLGKKIMEKMATTQLSDAVLGHTIVLCQYEWPKLMWLFTAVMARVSTTTGQYKRTRFSYPKLFSYVYCMDMLEEIAHLSVVKSGELTLDITETETTRKIGASTRHSVKGQKDDIRSMVEAQASVAGSSTAPSLYEIFLLFFSEQAASLRDVV